MSCAVCVYNFIQLFYFEAWCARWWLPSAHRAHKVSTNPPIFICIMYVFTCILLHLRRHTCLAQCAFYYTYLRIQLEARCIAQGPRGSPAPHPLPWRVRVCQHREAEEAM